MGLLLLRGSCGFRRLTSIVIFCVGSPLAGWRWSFTFEVLREQEVSVSSWRARGPWILLSGGGSGVWN
jgi:hypothetical protein